MKKEALLTSVQNRGSQKFKWRRNASLGSISAETDQEFLKSAFQDFGYLDMLRDTGNPRSVVIGRTGAGKSALLLKLSAAEPRTIRIKPLTLSLRYLSNSTIIRYLLAIGVNLDPFYQLLWRHALITELIRTHFKLDDAAAQKTFWQRIGQLFSGKRSNRKEKALEYFAQWTPEFWKDADVRIENITKTLDEKVSAEIGSPIPTFSAKAGAEEARSQKVEQEVVARVQKVVNEVSLEKIYSGFDIIKDDILADEQKRYFLIIDDLDKNWVELSFAYDLVDALLDAVAEFAEIPNVKVVVALRQNIVEALHAARGKQRQQREKHKSLFIDVRWTRPHLVKMIESRLDVLVRKEFGGTISLEALLPAPRKGMTQSTVDYLLDRTFLRPRDLIHFMNEILEETATRAMRQVSWAIIETAERRYSQVRLEGLRDEWIDNYSGMDDVLHLLHGLPYRFVDADIGMDRLLPLLSAGETESKKASPDLTSIPLACYRLYERDAREIDVWHAVRDVLFLVGAIGVKPNPREPLMYSYEDPSALKRAEPGAALHVHPGLYKALLTVLPTH